MRARLLLEMALDEIEGKLGDGAASMKELSGLVNALGRVSGMASTDVNVNGTVGHLHLAALQAPRTTANAKLSNANELAQLASGTEDTPHTDSVQDE